MNCRSAGTVEFIYDADRDDFFFLEVNTRLQVEHGITELVTGIDLVEWMARLALDDGWEMPAVSPTPQGCAIQARVYAEDPNHNFRPSCGLLTVATFPAWTRCDGWIEPGTEVSPFYDPLLAKVMVHAQDRAAAVSKIEQVLEETKISGIETNLRHLRDITRWAPYLKGGVAMRDMAEFCYSPNTIDVVAAGTMTTVQDWPGRVGYWEVGVPPCGPFDSLSLRLANTLVGNREGTAGLEITVSGPTLRFNSATTIALVGASALLLKNGEAVAMNQSIRIEAGDVVKLGRFETTGARAYFAVAGGIESPNYLGSCATFTLGKFGGPLGRALLAGDVLGIGNGEVLCPHEGPRRPLSITHHWKIAVLYGPHGAPDFFLG